MLHRTLCLLSDPRRTFEEAREYVRGPHAHVWVQAFWTSPDGRGARLGLRRKAETCGQENGRVRDPAEQGN